MSPPIFQTTYLFRVLTVFQLSFVLLCTVDFYMYYFLGFSSFAFFDAIVAIFYLYLLLLWLEIKLTFVC